MARYTFFGRQVHHPVGKAAIVAVVTGTLLACIPFSPLLYVVHGKLRARGRKGFFHDGDIIIGPGSFARRRDP